MLLLSIAAILGIALYFGYRALEAGTTHEMVEAGLLCCLSLLAALEHFFFAIPFRDSRLWHWALGEPKEHREI